MPDGSAHPEAQFTNSATKQLDEWLKSTGVPYLFLSPGVPMPTVPTAAAAIGVSEDEILKSLLFQDRKNEVVLVIASGATRVDRVLLEAVSGLERPKMAPPDIVLERTGFPAGGVAPVGHASSFPVYIDEAVMKLEFAYGGGGAEDVLLRLRPTDIVALTSAKVVSLTCRDL